MNKNWVLILVLLPACVRAGFQAGGQRADATAPADGRLDVIDTDADGSKSIDGSSDGPLQNVVRKWQLVSPVVKPPAMWGSKAVYFPKRQKILLYGGGLDFYVSYSAAMWEYDGTTWTKLCDPCPPGPRVGHGFVLDTKRGVIVLFGGLDTTGSKNDLWEYDGTAWAKKSPTGSAPSPRNGVYSAYDPGRDRTVVFGGKTGESEALQLFDDLFEYDGAAWHGPLKPAVRPSPRYDEGTGAAYADGNALHPAARGRIVLLGGLLSSSAASDESWAWDGTSWTRICDMCTKTARGELAMAYDLTSGRLVAVCGFNVPAYTRLNDTFELESSGWTLAATLPGKVRDCPAMAYHPILDRLVLYGGWGCGTGTGADNSPCGETLEYVRVP